MTTGAIFLPSQPGAFTAELVQMIDRAQAGVVQVRTERRGIGSGVIWSANGQIITNHHVVEGRASVQVLLTDERQLEATVVASDPSLDLALLKIAAADLPALSAGDSARLRVGELVFAVGHPWGVRGVATAGIVSGLGQTRAPGRQRPAPYVRTDTRLAPGNSGGPLINARGEVVGINSMVFGGDLGIAIPSQVVLEWLSSLPARRGHLGAGVQPVRLRLDPGERGEVVAGALRVVSVQAGGPASRSGLQVGDIVLEVAGERVGATGALLALLSRYEAGQRLSLRVLRASSGTIENLTLELGRVEQAA